MGRSPRSTQINSLSVTQKCISKMQCLGKFSSCLHNYLNVITVILFHSVFGKIPFLKNHKNAVEFLRHAQTHFMSNDTYFAAYSLPARTSFGGQTWLEY